MVTLVHKEDWDKFSQSVSKIIRPRRTLSECILQDAFPDDDTVWGVAYTIDPAYVAEVREYLGEYILGILT